MKLDIPVRFEGHESSPGLKRGGVLSIVRHDVEMLLDADHIPDFLEGDLSGLDGIHGTLHISDFKLPEGARTTIREEKGYTVTSIVAPTSVIEEQKAAAAAADPPPHLLKPSKKARCCRRRWRRLPVPRPPLPRRLRKEIARVVLRCAAARRREGRYQNARASLVRCRR